MASRTLWFVPIAISLMMTLGMVGCSRENDDTPEPSPVHDSKADSSEPDADQNAQPASSEDLLSQDRAEQTASDPSGDSHGDSFSRPVSILETQFLKRRPEDQLTIRLRKGNLWIIYPVPNTWEPEPVPEDAEYLSQLRIPAPDNADYGDAFLSVYAGEDESVFDVLNRWLEQVKDPAYTPQIRELEFLDGTLLLLTEFAGVGTYDPGAPDIEPAPDTMVLGAVIEGGPGGTLIMKIVGPSELVEHQRYRWDLLLRSMRILKKPPR